VASLTFIYVSTVSCYRSQDQEALSISPEGVFPAFVDKVQCSQIIVRLSLGIIDKAWLVSQLELAQNTPILCT
jgi:hypothetical protein